MEWDNIYKSGFKKTPNKRKNEKGAKEIRIKKNKKRNLIRYDRMTKTGTFKGRIAKHFHEATTVDLNTGRVSHYGGGENDPKRSFNKLKKKKKSKGRER